ncbi:MAG: phenylacetate--CoA ligase family protein [Acidobacteria bacterium]|nr:MAG: phenylacetate--CoA ligase family protein [Acidobacteriota bacterium]
MQGQRLERLLGGVYGPNRFYTSKLDRAGIRLDALQLPRDLSRLPLTTKTELVGDQIAHPPWGTAFSEPIDQYTRYCQTSSTTGRPLRWIDDNESWQWMLECWKTVYRGARVDRRDRIFFPFSFGPFLAFWTAFEAGCQIGAHCVPGGGMSSQLRLAMIETIEPTVLCCTPTYALRLAEVAAENRADHRPLSESSVRVLIVAGEPGGSIPATRERIERSWGARVIDHHGLTEVGPVSFECWEQPGFLHLNESEYVCEVLDPSTLEAVPDGQPGELVITNLGRTLTPVIRYRTGDIVVRRSDVCRCGRTWARLEGGILARADDMINVRGVNVYPSALESVVRQFDEVVEFRSTVRRAGAMRSLSLEIELTPQAADAPGIATRVTQQLREALGLTIPVHVADSGSLPRFEMKARRLVIEE